jgi:hypothetical protein
MKLSNEQIELLSELASLDLPVKSIAESIGVDPQKFILESNTPGTDIYNFYKSAALTSSALFMKKLNSNAKIGIPQSQALLRKISIDTRCENIKDFNNENII